LGLMRTFQSSTRTAGRPSPKSRIELLGLMEHIVIRLFVLLRSPEPWLRLAQGSGCWLSKRGSPKWLALETNVCYTGVVEREYPMSTTTTQAVSTIGLADLERLVEHLPGATHL
jgi:hypothetical protein